MTANTVYEVFQALSFDERAKLIVLVTEHKEVPIINLSGSKVKSIKFSKQDAIDYLLKNVFSKK